MNQNRVFKTASLVCLIVFVLSVAYMLAIVRLRYHFESTWNILPVTYAHCVAWPLCALSGIALPLLLSKGEVCLPGWLRILLAAAGGVLMVIVFWAAFGRNHILPGTGFGHFMYLLSAELYRMEGLMFVPCVPFVSALAVSTREKPQSAAGQETPASPFEPKTSPEPPDLANQ